MRKNDSDCRCTIDNTSGKSSEQRRVARLAVSAAVDASYRPPRDRNFIEPLARGLSILQAFTSEDNWLGNFEIASRVGLPNATVNRLLKTLAGLGYLAYSPQLRHAMAQHA